MCSCQQHSQGATERSAEATASDLAFTVADMACGHCAGAIKSAIETALQGTSVTADPTSKLVSVKGASDYAAVKSIVVKAGYTPSPELTAV